ncbi:MAG TPA: ornithine cyclodeaminase family protein [Blastocatellia bacterium]|nr:ornithine cyclodeaminase family protein [Blastocatellia bacterium]
MTLLLSQNDVASLLRMRDCITVIERAFADYANGQAEIPLRISLAAPLKNGRGYFMPGSFAAENPSFGMKIVTEFAANKNVGLPSILGIVILLDTETGKPLAIMDGRHVTNIRTGAASGVAAKYLARKDASTVGIIGFGDQAQTQLWAMSEVRSIKRVRAYSPSASQKTKLIAEISEKIKAPVEIAADPEEACQDADIIILATNKPGPVIKGDWVKPGACVIAVGLHTQSFGELDTDTIAKAQLVVCDERSAALKESGDIIGALNTGVITEDQLINLGDIILARHSGRTSGDQITVYRSLGNAFQDLATASYVYGQAKENGIGVEFDF